MAESFPALYFKPLTSGGDLEKISKKIFKIFNVKNITIREHPIPGEGVYYIAYTCGILINIEYACGECLIDGYDYYIGIQTHLSVPDETFMRGVADVLARTLVWEGYDVIRAERYVNKPETKYYRYKKTYDTYPEEPEKWVTVEPIELPPETLSSEA